MKIILMRHGQPSVSLSKKISLKDFPAWLSSYADANIIDTPPLHTTNLFRDFSCVVTSHSPRAIQSALQLTKNIYWSDPMFAEMDLPYVNDFLWPRLSASTWVIVFRLMWFAGFHKNAESFHTGKCRAQHAAQHLIELSSKHEDVLLLGHGITNRLIARYLITRNWYEVENTGGSYWSYQVLEKTRN